MLLPGPAQITPGGAGGGGLPNGGTTGQILDKVSNADQDAAWVNPAVASNNTPLVAFGAGSPGAGVNYSRDDHVHPSSGGSTDTVLGTRVYVPATLATNQLVGTAIDGAGTTATITKGQMNIFPIKLTQSATGFIGFYCNAAGSLDNITYAGVWNTHATLCRPGTQIDIFNVANPSTQSNNFSGSGISLQAGVTYWWGVWCTGTTAPTTGSVQVTDHLVGQGWTDNLSAVSNVTWRYTTVTTSTDLTGVNPTTGDSGGAAAFMFKSA